MQQEKVQGLRFKGTKNISGETLALGTLGAIDGRGERI
jgi:hypothetical protein